MTKEEALKIVRHMAYLSAHVVENGVEAYEYIEQLLSQSSAPSNLDEAAEKYADTQNKNFLKPEIVKNIFKAGVEWMAGRGVTVKGLLYGGNLGITDIPEEFYTDKEEEVIVQIRKKQ